MFVTFDYKCRKCDVREERFTKKSEVEEQECKECSSPMDKLPAGTRTTFRFADTKLKA